MQRVASAALLIGKLKSTSNHGNEVSSGCLWARPTDEGRARSSRLGFLVAAMLLGIAGCGSPSAVNIELRKQNQALKAQVDQLTAQHQRDVATLSACEKSHPTTRMLAPDQLEQLFTTHGLKISNLTGGDNPDSTKRFDTQLKIYAVPIDGDGAPIKAAGSFKVEAFDLDDPKKPSIGIWTFDLNQSRGMFYSQLLLYCYVLNCPWQTVPVHAGLTVKITFDDSLTGREFTEQVQIKVRPPIGRP